MISIQNYTHILLPKGCDLAYMKYLIVFLITSFWFGTAFSEPVIHVDKEYYEFNANTKKQVWQQIQRAGGKAKSHDGSNHWVRVAWTAYDLDLKYSYRAGLYQCKLASYTPILKVTVTLPHWKNKWQADAVLAENWDNYVRMVSSHENVHKEYALEMVQDLDKRLAELSTTKSCRELIEQIKKTQQQVIAENRAKNKWFDAKELVYQKNLKWF